MPRRYHRTRYEVGNGVTLCWVCHTWAHDNPNDFADWVTGVVGAGEYARLRTLAVTTSKVVPRRTL
jgi:hypothetical protein